jgi:hypothetical protein
VTRSHRIIVEPLGPIIQVGLNVGATQTRLGLGGSPLSKNGLIDTGATRTAISAGVYQALQPAVSGSAPFQRPGLPQMVVPTYAVRPNCEGHLSGNPWFDLDAVVADAATPGIDVLIGMDVLSQLIVFYEGVNGTMILSY